MNKEMDDFRNSQTLAELRSLLQSRCPSFEVDSVTLSDHETSHNEFNNRKRIKKRMKL